MSVLKLTIGCLAVLAITSGIRNASAHDGEHMPFADPFAFEPDFRWFEPVTSMDLADMRPSKRASIGWYGGADLMQLWVNRPQSSTTYYNLDSTWGSRLDFGFMNEERHGWQATYSQFGSPGASRVVALERLNRLNPEDLAGQADDDDGFIDPRGQLLPEADRNTPGFSERLYFPGESQNQISMRSFELNKAFRMEPYHYGGMLEPLIGVRYMRVRDHYFRSTYRSTDSISYPLIVTPEDDEVIEQFTTEFSTANNYMVGGQLGFRYFKFYDRFMLSTDFRAFSMHNFQSNFDSTVVETTVYDDLGLESEVEQFERARLGTIDRRGDRFVYGFDTRVELAYTVTRNFNIRGGVQHFTLARGLWRGRLSDSNDQALHAIGYTFGITINR